MIFQTINTFHHPNYNPSSASHFKLKGVKMKKGGKVFARVDKQEGSGTLRLKMSGSKLKNVEGGMFGKSDPFFQLLRKDYGKKGFEWNSVHRSNVVKNDLSPVWKESTIQLSDLCGADLDAPLMLAVYDNESSGKVSSYNLMLLIFLTSFSNS